MAFSDFTFPEVLSQFTITWRATDDLFRGVPAVAPQPFYRDSVGVFIQLASTLNTEKARSEWIIAPLLGDFWSRYHGQISLFSGVELNADPAAGLNGFCDFIISRAPQQPQPVAPLMVILEAKRENINDGLGQCIAAMVGAQRFNAKKNAPIDPLYGCITTGTAWKFLQLQGSIVSFDLNEFTISQPDILLGILTSIVGLPAASPVAA